MMHAAWQGLAGLGALLAVAPSFAALRAQTPAAPTVIETAFALPDGGTMRYAIALPADHEDSPDERRPLVLALHPGGRDVYYGSWFMRSIVEPALRGWEPVIVAPDVPDESWATERSERAILALLDAVLAEHAIDRDRILVTGFSMGGRGTWYMVGRHPDLFAGAIMMATGPPRESVESLASTPIYIIHSPDDEVVPYAPVEEAAVALAGRGYPVQMARLPGATHGMMGDYVGPLRAAGDWMLRQWDGDQSR
jgi:dipeptidyl aminopeptidase/acylaminoacyl peptidase